MSTFCLIGLLVAWNLSSTLGQTREDFIRALLVHYDSRIPPNFEKDVPCEVNVRLHINSIDSIDEQTMEFTLNAFITQTWVDPRLRFNNLISADYLELDARLLDSVWVPDLYFRNEKRAHFHTVTTPNKMLHIYENGSVVYKSRISLTASCPMNLQLYPMDRQKCSLIIQSFAYTSNRLVFHWDDGDAVTLNTELALPQFTLERNETTNCSFVLDGKRGSGSWHGNTCLQLNMYLRRNIGFYMINIYVPSCLVVMLSWLSFWLHVDAVPARVTLGILTVLTVTTQRTSSTASLPHVSYIKAIDIWMAVSLCFVFCALLEYAFVNVLDRRQKRKQLNGPVVIHELQNGKTEETTVDVTSKKSCDLAMMVDNFSRVFFPLAYLIFGVSYIICFSIQE